MNSINFINDKKKFPLSTQVLDFLQAIVKQAHKLALIGGSDKYILAGCELTTSNTYNSGYVVINGEILQFTGGSGSAASSVRIKETTSDIIAEYDTYSNALVTRILEFGSNVGGVDTYTWNTFTRIKTNIELAATYATKDELSALSNLLMPKGGIIMWSGAITSIPAGFALCDGSTNADWGGNVPDLRGRFIVGYNGSSNNLPAIVTDGLEENYAAIGNRGGKPKVLLSADQSGLRSHNHGFTSAGIRKSDIDGTGSQKGAEFTTDGTIFTTDNAAALSASDYHENRPPYFVLAFIIKVI
ncbi:MAG: hypothetical protein PHH37_08265 [Paludibacter sp.]|nr:hypothetical protein [Paludibacter sp.]